MYYSEEVIMDVRSGNDIVDVIGDYVKLNRRGANYFGLCPFHNEKTPSFTVSREKQIYHCFGCGAGGNVFKFIEEREGMTFPEAVKHLADRINYTIPEAVPSKDEAEKRAVREKLWDINKAAGRFFYDCLNSNMGAEAREYLDGRALTKATRNKFGLGYAPKDGSALNKYLLEKGFEQDMILRSGLVHRDAESGRIYCHFFNRVMYPIIDVRGHIIAFAGRKLDEDKKGGKYINSPETEIYKKSFNPYNLNLARLSNQREFIIVEGYMDVISLYQAGFKNAIALCGTAMNDNHTSVIKRYKQEIIILLDSDISGENAALKAIPVLQRAGITPKVLQVKNAKDPDEFIKKFGADAFARLLKNAMNQVIFRINVLKKRYTLDTSDGKIAFTNEAVQILSETKSNIELDVYINEVAKDTGISAEVLKTEVERIRGKSGEENINAAKPSAFVKNVIVNNALEDAKSGLINLISTDRAMFERAKRVLDKAEFEDEFYIRLYDIIVELYEQNKHIGEADVLTRLDGENAEEQSRAAMVFMGRLPYDSAEQKYTALFDSVKTIKRAYLETRIDKETDDAEVMRLLNEKKGLDSYLKSKL